MRMSLGNPERNVGRVDRLLRAVLAACTLAMAGFGLFGAGLNLIDLTFALLGGYFAVTAARAVDPAYRRLLLDTRSEEEANAQRWAADRAAEAAAAELLARGGSQVGAPEPDPTWGGSLLGR